MAITKLMTIKSSKKNNKVGKHLINSLEYILNPEKTGGGIYTGSVNCLCNPEIAYKQMYYTKKKFGKTDKRQGYHFVLSLKEGEGDENIMMNIVKEFIEKYFNNEYEVVYAVHNNTDKIHAHLVFNAVNSSTGRKYRYENGDWERIIQPLVNQLCLKYGVSELNLEDLEQCRKENKKSNKKKASVRDRLKEDIDNLILESYNFDEFTSKLKEQNYKFSYGRYFSIKPPYSDSNIRTRSLGEMYTEDNIKARIAKIHSALYLNKEVRLSSPKIVRVKVKFQFSKRLKYAQMSEYQKRNFLRVMRIRSVIGRKNKNYTWKFKDDIRKIRKSEKELFYLVSNNIKSEEELENRKDIIQKDNFTLYDEIKKLNKEKKIYARLIEAAQVVKEYESKYNFDDFEEIKQNATEYNIYLYSKKILEKTEHSIDEIDEYIENHNVRLQNLKYKCRKNYEELRMIDSILRKNSDERMLEKDPDAIINDKSFNNFDELSATYEKKSITFEHAFNRHTDIDYSSDESYYIVERLNPSNYIEVNTERKIFEGEEYTKSDYFIYVNNELRENSKEGREYFTDEKFKGRDKYYWYNLRKEMKRVSGLSDDLLYLKSDSFDRYVKLYKEKQLQEQQLQRRNVQQY